MSKKIFSIPVKSVDNGYPLNEEVDVLLPHCRKSRKGYITKSKYGYNFYFVKPGANKETFCQLTGSENILYNGNKWTRWTYEPIN